MGHVTLYSRSESELSIDDLPYRLSLDSHGVWASSIDWCEDNCSDAWGWYFTTDHQGDATCVMAFKNKYDLLLWGIKFLEAHRRL